MSTEWWPAIISKMGTITKASCFVINYHCTFIFNLDLSLSIIAASEKSCIIFTDTSNITSSGNSKRDINLSRMNILIPSRPHSSITNTGSPTTTAAPSTSYSSRYTNSNRKGSVRVKSCYFIMICARNTSVFITKGALLWG